MTYANRDHITEVLNALHGVFGANISGMPSDISLVLEEIDSKSRGLLEILERAKNKQNAEHHEFCICLADEVFSDVIQSMYLISSGLIVPGRMVARRALELGLAVPYFWDQPGECWAWAEHDEDLGFAAMVTYLFSKGYHSHLKKIGINEKDITKYNSQEYAVLYRSLSNTVHGKKDIFPQFSPDRFDIAKNDAIKHLYELLKVVEVLLAVLSARFPN